MVNFKKLADRAKDVVEKQGGPDALKDKADKMKQAAAGKGSIGDKAKAAAAAAKEKPAPEAAAQTQAPGQTAAPAQPAATPAAEPIKDGTTGDKPPSP
jgi:hypothetical protein